MTGAKDLDALVASLPSPSQRLRRQFVLVRFNPLDPAVAEVDDTVCHGGNRDVVGDDHGRGAQLAIVLIRIKRQRLSPLATTGQGEGLLPEPPVHISPAAGTWLRSTCGASRVSAGCQVMVQARQSAH